MATRRIIGLRKDYRSGEKSTQESRRSTDCLKGAQALPHYGRTMPDPIHSSLPEFQLDLNPDRRREFAQELNRRLAAARAHHVRLCHEKGGRKSCSRLAADMDEILRSVYDWLVEETRPGRNEYGRLAVVAQGGYGRAVMNLHSDVDLLFLMPENPTPVEQGFVRSFLYLLWDLNKLDLGYAVKRPTEALQAVGLDLDSTTALINLRLVAGNQGAVDDLVARLEKQVRGPGRKWFVESKIAEARNRREKYGSSVYLLEPNLKDGEGGLRDIHSLQWLSYVLLGSSSLETLVEKGVWEKEELARVEQAMDFVLAARTLLHEAEGRKVDMLTFDKQPSVAKALGYRSDEQLLAEEKMMKDYYLNARSVDRYSQKATRILTVRARSLLGGMMDVIRRRSVDRNYHTKGGVLFLRDGRAGLFQGEPWRAMECFWVAANQGVVLSEELKDSLIAAHGVTDTDDFRESAKCRDYFMKVLGLKKGAAQGIHAMHETGILGDYMPEFRKLFCLARIDHYHRYTVDEHLIKTLEVSEALLSGAPDQRAELVQAARSVKRWDLLNLSLLLHDIGKGEGHGHVLRGAILSQNMTQRMGLEPDEQEVVRQLILQHLRMAHISQRRDLEDPNVIGQMAAHVPDPELLKMLYLLTYCDTRAVGPNTWSDWKAMLLYDLFRKTTLVLEGKNPIAAVSDEMRARLAREIGEIAGDGADPERIEQFVNNAPPKYLSLNPPEKMTRHMAMLEHLDEENRIYWEIEEPPGMNYTEITAVSFDRPGFMSCVCGALSSKDVNILSVQVFSTKDGFAIDTFQVTDLRGNKLPHGFRLDRLRTDLNQVLLKKVKVTEKFPVRRKGKSARPDFSAVKPSQILFDHESTPDFTIVEVKTYDRPGLLYEITNACAENGNYIHLAMITTEAYRVVDVFYLTDFEFNKLDPPQVKKLQKALEPILA